MTRRTAGIVSVIVMLLVSIIGPSSAVDASWRTINQLEIDDSASSVCRDGMRLRLGEIHIPFVTTLADVQSIPADSVRTIEFTAASPAPPFGSGSSGRLFDFPFPPESVAAQRTLTMRKAPIWMVTIDGRPGVELSDYVLGAQIFDAYSGTFFIPWAVELAPGASVALELDDTSGPHDQTFYTVADCHVFPTPPGLSLTVPAALTVEATSPAGAPVEFSVSASAGGGAAPPIVCAKPSTPDVPSDSDLIDYISVVPGDTFPLGDTRVTCVVNDGLGQVISKSFTVTVRDSTPPTLNVPTSVIVNATDPSGAGVSYVVTATDLVTSADLITITCHPTSGATFASGTTSVSCTAVDQAGNVSPASTFPVTVLGAAAQLRDLRAIVVAMTMPLPTKVSLLIVVDGARLALALNKPSVACGLLSTFSAQVRAQSGQRLTLAQADQLLASATRVRHVLNCS